MAQTANPMFNKSRNIKLEGGLCHGEATEASQWTGGDRIYMPVVADHGEAVRAGVAVYEINEQRTHAFWLENEWDAASKLP